eukprot:gene8498-biopygen5839
MLLRSFKSSSSVDFCESFTFTIKNQFPLPTFSFRLQIHGTPNNFAYYNIANLIAFAFDSPLVGFFSEDFDNILI